MRMTTVRPETLKDRVGQRHHRNCAAGDREAATTAPFLGADRRGRDLSSVMSSGDALEEDVIRRFQVLIGARLKLDIKSEKRKADPAHPDSFAAVSQKLLLIPL